VLCLSPRLGGILLYITTFSTRYQKGGWVVGHPHSFSISIRPEGNCCGGPKQRVLVSIMVQNYNGIECVVL